MKKSSRMVSWVRASLVAIALLVVGGLPLAHADDTTSCLCDCYFDRDCPPGNFCNFKPTYPGTTPSSCLSNNLNASCGTTSKVCDGICSPIGADAPNPASPGHAACDVARYGSCECNPRLNLMDEAAIGSNPVGSNPQCGAGEICVADGGCCTVPGECTNAVATCNGRCVTPDRHGNGTPTACGNGALDAGEECDPGDPVTGVPPIDCTDAVCVNCSCVTRGYCGND